MYCLTNEMRSRDCKYTNNEKEFGVNIFLIHVVAAETCRDAGGCTATSCSGGSTIHCVNHQCTCTTAASGSGNS